MINVPNQTPAAFRADLNGVAQTGLTLGAWALIAMTTKRYDIGTYFSTTTHLWTPPAGKVHMKGSVDVGGVASNGTLCGIAIFKNGSLAGNQFYNVQGSSIAAGAGSVQIMCDDVANGSDTYGLFGYPWSGTSRQFVGSIDLTFFCGHWFSP